MAGKGALLGAGELARCVQPVPPPFQGSRAAELGQDPNLKIKKDIHLYVDLGVAECGYSPGKGV